MKNMDDIVYKYYMIVTEYLRHMSESELLKTLDNSSYIVCIGLNIIIYIFQISMNVIKNIDSVYGLCQNAYYCYLEYIEQMHKTDSMHDLTNIDAILFVYKKTFDNSSMSNDHIHPSLQNIIVSNNTTYSLKYIIHSLSILTKTILFFETEFLYNSSDNKYINSIHVSELELLSKNQLYKFLSLLTAINTNSDCVDYDIICNYMQYIQEKLKMSYDDYVHYLEELYKILRKNQKSNIIITKENTLLKTIDLFLNQENKTILMNLLEKKEYKLLTKKLWIMNK